MKIDDEVVIGRICEEANGALRYRRFSELRKDRSQCIPHGLDFIVLDSARHIIRRWHNFAAVHY